MKNKPFQKLHSQKIGPYLTQVRYQPKRKIGHFEVKLNLKRDDGELSLRPLVQGVYSKGNVSQNIQGWLDIHYSDKADFKDQNPVVLSKNDDLAENIFEILGKVIEPGGMMFVSLITDIVWEMQSDLHRITRKCLEIRSLEIPPAATSLGRLLFISGCQNVKSQGYDVQGSSRIAGEKAPNPEVKKEFLRRIRTQLQEYLNQQGRENWTEIHKICLVNAQDILNRIIKN